MRLLLFFSALFLSTVVLANTADEQLLQRLNNIITLQANFKQTMYDHRNMILQSTAGQMALKRPGQFRWEVTYPNKQLIITNGKTLWIYDVDLEQVTIRRLVSTTGDTPALLLTTNKTSLNHDFVIRLIKQASAVTEKFLLIPKDKNNLFTRIMIEFFNHQINAMQLQDHLGHMTRIEFQQVVVNANLSENLFHFKVPPGVDVLDETHH